MGKRGSKKARRAELVPAVQRHGFDYTGALGHESTYQINVTEQIALGSSVFLSGVRTLADCVSGGNVGEWRGTDELPASRLVRRPYAPWTRRRWLWRAVATMATYSVFRYHRRGVSLTDGKALDLVPLHPSAVSYSRPGYVMLYGRDEVPESEIGEIWRHDWPTVSQDLATILYLARDAFAASWAADRYTADYWENGGAPAVILTTDQKLADGDAELYSDRWATRRAAAPGKPITLGQGLKAETFGADVGATGAAEAGERLDQAIARYVGIHPWIVNVASAAGSMVYSNAQHAGVDLVRYSLDGYIGPIADALSEELPGDYLTGRQVRIDVSELTVGTMLERFQAYQIATGGAAWMTREEVRNRLGMGPTPLGEFELPADGASAPIIERIPEGI